MNDSLVSSTFVPPEALAFSAENGLDGQLDAVIDLAQRAFPSSALSVSLGQDAEEETHRYIALDIDSAGLTVEEILNGQGVWSAELGRVCPSSRAVYFVLGWR